MTFIGDFPEPTPLRGAVEAATRADENERVLALVQQAELSGGARARISEAARALVGQIRRAGSRSGGLDAFIQEYELTNAEGVVLMCLAEALLRIPDAKTANRLIRDKVIGGDWEGHLGHSQSLLVNASTWALMLTGRVIELDGVGDVGSFLKRLVARSGEPVIRGALIQAMRILGQQFVMGRTIGEALRRSRDGTARGYTYSFDMLGESAHTAVDARRYLEAYAEAIGAVAREGGGVARGPGISIKLSALHPRYEFAQRRRVMEEMVPALMALAVQAKEADIGFLIDAEEAERLDLSLDVIEAVSGDKALAGWDGLGLAVQAYQKRAPHVIDWLEDMALRHRRRLMVRLVKGAYWDTEIKRAQERGLDGYPVFTRKVYTDVSYLASAARLLASPEAIVPLFATHNAYSLAAVREMAGPGRVVEFQRLHGMGEALYDPLVERGEIPCRMYAPVGSHEDLLPYLVRRLLENGSNTSFVNRIVQRDTPVDEVIADPVVRAAELGGSPHPRIPLPPRLYCPGRRNSRGVDLNDPASLRPLDAAMEQGPWRAAPLVGGSETAGGEERRLLDPADRGRLAGTVAWATAADMEAALVGAASAAPVWDATPAEARAACLERAADLMEDDRAGLMSLAVREAGKTIPDALAEVREAVDFCRYYANCARTGFARPETLPGPTGELNRLSLHGRGVFACVAPWNFPLAIFTGQVAAALAAGNAVIAKPAEQTPLMGARAVSILHRAGVPGEALHLLPGDGPEVGAPLVTDARISGVSFTGSVETARAINGALARRPGPIVPLIAETGGLNAMIVDSTALPEQVVEDAVASAFQSAGQRCSALRVLFVQRDIAGGLLDMLAGATAELAVGDSALLETDVGPVIDGEALGMLENHARRMERQGSLLSQAALTDACAGGTFFAPRVFLIESLELLEDEVFGPILHVIEYDAHHLDQVIEAVNATGFGLTAGVHSRVDATQHHILGRLRVGNSYVNRNIIGAVVGAQPFGGEGLSGTGPKAGGPRYLHRFATERCVSVNTAAAGGNATLMSLAEDDAPQPDGE